MSYWLPTTSIGERGGLLSALLGLCPVGIVALLFIGACPLRAQNNSPVPAATNAGALPANVTTKTPPPASDLEPVGSAQDTASSTNAIQPRTVATPQVPLSKAAAEMTTAMQALKSEGKLTSNRSVAAAVRKVINNNSTQHELAAPMGAKVIAVHKRPGDVVRVGDKIVTLELNGKQIPILAKQEGVMQTINVSKGGVIGNSRPRAAQHTPQQGTILLILRNI